MSKKIHLLEPSFTGNEKKYLLLCLKSTWISTSGRLIEKFENKIKDFTKSKYAIACMNGTSALHISLKVCGVKKGDEVIAPTITFIAPINAIDYCNADPIFMDADDFHNIDVKKVMSFLNTKTYMKNNFCYNKVTNKRISAIVIVHVWGNLADLENLVQICRKKKIKIVEDASEALGSFYSSGKLKGKHAGTIGDIGCLSFNGNKIITTGAGGMILTNNKLFYEKAKYLTTQAKDNSKYYVHNEVGYNYRLTNLHSAIGLAQIEKLKKIIKLKKNIHILYKKMFSKIKGLKILENPSFSKSNNWLNILKVTKEFKRNTKWIEKKLSDNNIESRFIWKANHKQKQYFNKFKYKIFKSEKIIENSLCLPSSANLKKDDILKIVNLINE
tara:strand:+ start:2093 stop:3250 length:1158 start_codon:yes stop_codon:yes gene_type:complete